MDRSGARPEPSGFQPESSGLFIQGLDHAAKIPAAAKMQMEMGNFLMRIDAVIGEHPVSRFDQSQITGDPARRPHKCGHFIVRRPFRKIIEGNVGAFWYHQNMDWCLRVDVPESQDMIVFVYPVTGNLAAQDLRENIAVIVSH
jgi:hypothetical protein